MRSTGALRSGDEDRDPGIHVDPDPGVRGDLEVEEPFAYLEQDSLAGPLTAGGECDGQRLQTIAVAVGALLGYKLPVSAELPATPGPPATISAPKPLVPPANPAVASTPTPITRAVVTKNTAAAPTTTSPVVSRATPVVWDGRWLVVQLLAPTAAALILCAVNAARWYLTLGGGLMVAVASYALGWGVGFLFGYPKMVAQKADSQERYQANTNLEKISDWAPTVLMGIGIAEAREAATFINEANLALGAALDMEAMILNAMVLVSLLAGTIRGYLETRLRLQKSMLHADQECSQYGHVGKRGSFAESSSVTLSGYIEPPTPPAEDCREDTPPPLG